MAIIETYLYTQIITCDFPERVAALALSVYGIAAMAGAVVSGGLCGRAAMKNVLTGLYAARTIMALAFLLLPKSLVTVFGFAVLLGLTRNATVPPTSGLTERLFGSVKLRTLFGVVFFFHQSDAFPMEQQEKIRNKLPDQKIQEMQKHYISQCKKLLSTNANVIKSRKFTK